MAIKRLHICWPALLYLVVGLTNVAADFVSFANEHVKTNERFLMISVKLVAIFLITIGLNLLCVNKLFYLCLIITGALSLYLIMDAVRIMQRIQPQPVAQPYTPLPVNPIFHLKTMETVDPHDFLTNNMIGFDSRTV